MSIIQLNLIARDFPYTPKKAIGVCINSMGDYHYMPEGEQPLEGYTFYSIDEICARYHELSGKPKEWVHDWANWRAQDKDGTWREQAKEPGKDSYRWHNHHDEFWPGDVVVGKGEVIGDWRETLEERCVSTAAESEIPTDLNNKSEAQAEEYMPEVGEVCEARFRHPGTDYSDWFGNAKFKGGYDSKIWFCCDVNEPFSKEMVLPAHDVEFRPVKSERDECLESMVQVVYEKNIREEGMGSPEQAAWTIAEALYDAGYRLTEGV